MVFYINKQAVEIKSKLDGYFKPGEINDELYELLKYAYNDQNGKEPGYKPTKNLSTESIE